MRSFSIVAFLAMAACDGGNTDSGSATDDTGTEVIGTAVVNMVVLKKDVEEDCSVTLTGSKSYSNISGVDTVVAAPDTYTVVAGDPAYTAQFGFPVHMDADGEYWAAEPKVVDVEADQVMNGEIRLFNLFAPGVYTCTTTSYTYDPDVSSLKGAANGTYEFSPEAIAVDQFGVVHPEDENQNWDAVGDAADYLRVVDDQLELVVMGEGITTYLVASNVGPAGFDLTVVNETLGYVGDVSCSM